MSILNLLCRSKPTIVCIFCPHKSVCLTDFIDKEIISYEQEKINPKEKKQ